MNYQIIRYSDINPESLKKVFKSLSLEYLEGTSIIHGRSQVEFFLRELAYPNIDIWYQKIIAEINNDPQSREMFICLSNEENLLSISGLMILKTHVMRKNLHIESERKLSKKRHWVRTHSESIRFFGNRQTIDYSSRRICRGLFKNF